MNRNQNRKKKTLKRGEIYMLKKITSSVLAMIIICSVFVTTPFVAQAAKNNSKISAPKSVKVSAVNSTTSKITWKKSTNAKSYRVYRATSLKGKYKVVGKISKSKNYFVNKKLKTGKVYYYKVAAFSSSKKAISKAIKYRAVPGIVKGVSVKKSANKKLTIRWQKTSDVSGYLVVGSPASNMKQKQKKQKINNKNTVKITYSNIATNKNYYVRVRSFKKVGKKLVYGPYSSKIIYKPTNNAAKITIVNGRIPKDITKEKVTYKKDNTTKFTRAQWIYLLVHKNGLHNTNVVDEGGYSFSDIKNHRYAKEIEIAYQNGIIPDPVDSSFDPEQDVRTFMPNEPATREFAAYTAVASQGFESDQSATLTCSDKDSVKYKTHVALAISNGFMNTSNNKFYPNSAMTGTDRNQIFAKIVQLKKSISIDSKKIYQNMVYDNNVKKNTSSKYTIKSLGNKKYSVTISGKANYKVGSVVVLSPNKAHPSGFPIKVISCSYSNSSKKTVIMAATPDIKEVYDDIQFQGCGSADVGNIKTAPGVVCKYDKNGEIGDKGYGFGINKEINTSVPGKLTFSVDKKVSENVKVKGDVEFSIPKINARVDAHLGWKGLKVNDLLISITKKANFTGSLEGTFLTTGYEITHGSGRTDFVPGSWELGRLPVYLGNTGLSIDVVLNFTISVKGEISLNYTIVTTEGIQYTNGSLRHIKEGSNELSSLTAKASAKIGFEVEVGLWAIEAFNLFGMQLDIGLGADVSFTPHNDVFCGDGKLYAYLSVGTDSDCLFCKATNLNWQYDFWDSSESPFLKTIHIENAHIVDKCRFDSGTLEGKIVKSNGEPISGARVQLSKGATSICTVYSNQDGSFKSLDMSGGEYDVVVSATGYKKYISRETVVSGQNTFAESYVMIPRNGANTGTAYGGIIDAVTGNKIDNVTYKVFSGWNNTSSDVIASGVTSSNYIIELEPGNYTIQFSANNYSGNIINVAIESDIDKEQVVVLNPYDPAMEGKFRVVLTWGEYPLDIDSHMYGTGFLSDNIFHVFWDNDYYYEYTDDENDENVCDLDVDDRYSYGPETITIRKMNRNGKYSYYVHDYSNRSYSSSYALSNSGAIVRVYSGNDLIATFNVPTNRIGTVWHVFDYDASTDTIKPINDFYSQYDCDLVNVPE